MLIPDVLGFAPGRLERLLAVVAREGATLGVFLYDLTYVHAIHMGAWVLLILKFLVTLRTNVYPRHLFILVAISHVSLETRVDVVRDATLRTGEGHLGRVGDDDLTFC